MNTQLSILISILILSTSCSKVDKFEAQTEHMSNTTDSLNKKTGEMLEITKKMLDSTTNMAKITEGVGNRTDKMLIETKGMGVKTGDMLDVTKGLGVKTDKMAAITVKMGEKTDKMAEITKKMLTETENLKRMARAKEAEETRGRAFRQIDSARSFNNKTIEAAIFHKAFEYQLWTNTGEDTLHYRDVLLKAAMKEYFRKTEDYLGELSNWNRKIMSPDTKKNVRKNVYALGVTLHEIQDYQEEIAKRYDGIEKISILNIFQNSLTKYEEIKRGDRNESDLKDYERVVIENQKNVKFLLWARYDMLSAMVLNNISNIKEKNDLSKLFGMVWSKWNHNFAGINFEKQKTTNIYLKECLRTRAFLKSIGAKNKLNSNIEKIYKKMRLPSKLKSSNSCINCEANYNEFKGYIGEMLN